MPGKSKFGRYQLRKKNGHIKNKKTMDSLPVKLPVINLPATELNFRANKLRAYSGIYHYYVIYNFLGKKFLPLTKKKYKKSNEKYFEGDLKIILVKFHTHVT